MAQKRRIFHAYISVLIGSDSYKLGLWKGEALALNVSANVLHPILRHLHDVQPRLVLMQRLQDNHLHINMVKQTNKQKILVDFYK